MPTNIRDETRFFLECLAEAAGDTVALLMNPTLGRFTSGAHHESFERKLRNLAARGIITLPHPTDRRVVRLTRLGLEHLRDRLDPEVEWRRPWDGRWRFVLFDVAEADRRLRDRLRAQLALARLGYLQGSVWVSPDPLDDLRRKMSALGADPESLLFLDGRPCAGESDDAIVAAAWNFPKIDEAYRRYLVVHDSIPGLVEPAERWRVWLAHERAAWQEVARLDPLLPACLHPAGYLGRKAVQARRRSLRAFATHHFRALGR